jgi:hypothetical protein
MGTDQRNYAYEQQGYGLCALFDPNAFGDADACRQSISDSLTYITTPQRDATGNWPMFYFTEISANLPTNPTPDATNAGASVCVVNGSPTVTIAGGFFFQPLNGSAYGAGILSGPTSIWFFPANTTMPATNAGGDPSSYLIGSLNGGKTVVTLTSNYTGVTKCTGFSGINAGYAVFDANGDVPFIGWGSQPMFDGLLGLGFAWESLGMRCATPGVPTNCDTTKSLLLQGYTVDLANWENNPGYHAASTGMYQGAGFVNCPAPIVNVTCFAGNNEAERVLAHEASGVIEWAWRFTSNPTFKTLEDAIFAGSWSNPTQMPNYQPGGGYIQSSLSAAKSNGQSFGISSQPSWLAARIGALGQSVLSGGAFLAGGASLQ